jgi:hypothetical protein
MKDEFKKLINKLKVHLLPISLVITASGVVLFYLWKNLNKVKLNKWLEEYISKINEMLKEEGKDISIETISYILHLNSEIADYFFNNEYYDVEKNRLQAFEDNKDGLYDLYIIETITGYDSCLRKAKRLLKNRLKIQVDKLEERIKDGMNLQTIYKLKHYRKQYDILPYIKKEKLIECYLYYAENKKRNFYLDQKEMNLMKKHPLYQQKGSLNIFRNKYKIVDYVFHNYNIHYKYLDQLVKQNNFLLNAKVKYFCEEINVLQDYV